MAISDSVPEGPFGTARNPIVRQATRWCLEHLAAHAAVLVGVTTGSSSARFHVVPLAPDDPLTDLGTLAIPPSWVIVIVVCDGDLVDEQRWSRVAVGVDRRTGVRHRARRFTAGGAK